jgi:hypothetical protein
MGTLSYRANWMSGHAGTPRRISKHRGSKPDKDLAKARNRAANKVARASRRANR